MYCVDALARYADIIVVNISCPNNGSRQNVEPLENILTSVVEATKRVNRKTKPVVMVKVSFSKRRWFTKLKQPQVSPDEDSDAQISGIW